MIRALQYFLCATAVFLIGLAVSAPAAVADAKSDAMVRAMAAVRADRWEDAVTEAKKVGPEAQSFVEWRRLRAGVGACTRYPFVCLGPRNCQVRRRGCSLHPGRSRPGQDDRHRGDT